MYFESALVFLYFSFLKYVLWLLNLRLKVVPVASIQAFSSVLVLFRFCRFLYYIVSQTFIKWTVAFVVFVLFHWFLLIYSQSLFMAFFYYFTHVVHAAITVFLFMIFDSLLFWEKCVSIILKNILSVCIFTVLLQVGFLFGLFSFMYSNLFEQTLFLSTDSGIYFLLLNILMLLQFVCG